MTRPDLPICHAVLSAMAEGVVFRNLKGEFVEFNDAACRILRLTPAQIRGKTARDPQWRTIREDGADFPPDHHPAMVTAKTGQPCYGVVMGVQSHGARTTWIEINSKPVKDAETGEILGVVSIFADITPQMLVKKAMPRDQSQSAEPLANARLRLEKLAVEIARPGNALAGHAGVVRRYAVAHDLPEPVAKAAMQMEAAAETLIRLLTDLDSDRESQARP